MLIVASCTAHAFLYLDDLIVGLAFPREADAAGSQSGTDYAQNVGEYFLSFRFNILTCYLLRVLNVRHFPCARNAKADSDVPRASAINSLLSVVALTCASTVP